MIMNKCDKNRDQGYFTRKYENAKIEVQVINGSADSVIWDIADDQFSDSLCLESITKS